ncbi:MAG: hypothetical protein KGL39_00535 [Patescibacteria group bacterium]|nr:hypothetical protein [Patescibacteria group bacterium]
MMSQDYVPVTDEFLEKENVIGDEQEKIELVGRLEWCSQLLMNYVSVLRGEVEDRTGLGAWMIFTQNLEGAAHVKVVPVEDND